MAIKKGRMKPPVYTEGVASYPDVFYPETSSDMVKDPVSGVPVSQQITDIDAQISLDATNLVTNGSFESDLAGWSTGGGSPSISTTEYDNGVKSLNCSSTGTSAQVTKSLTGIVGHIYYVSAKIKITRFVAGACGIRWIGISGSPSAIQNAINDGFRMVSLAGVLTTATSVLYVGGFSAANLDGFIDNVMILDLTAIFGAGNEPTAAQMDNILSFYPNSWFDGTVNLGQNAKLVPYLLNQICNLNAEKTSYGVYSGLGVTAQSTPDMTVKVDTGIIYMDNGKRFTPTAVAAQSVTAADATNPRIDIIYVDAYGVIRYLAGTASASPSAPAVPTGGQKIAEISVMAGTTSIAAANIADRRKTLTGEAWITPTLLNGWIQADAANYPVAYYKDSVGIVRLRGSINNGTYNTSAFALPVGYRPSKTALFLLRSGNGSTVGFVTATGNVYPTSIAYTSQISLDGISFRAEA